MVAGPTGGSAALTLVAITLVPSSMLSYEPLTTVRYRSGLVTAAPVHELLIRTLIGTTLPHLVTFRSLSLIGASNEIAYASAEPASVPVFEVAPPSSSVIVTVTLPEPTV